MTENIFCQRSAFTSYSFMAKGIGKIRFFLKFFKFSVYTNYEQGDNNKF